MRARPNVLTIEDIERAARAIKSAGSGPTTAVIAARVGCSVSQVRSRLHAAGWVLRGRTPDAVWLEVST